MASPLKTTNHNRAVTKLLLKHWLLVAWVNSQFLLHINQFLSIIKILACNKKALLLSTLTNSLSKLMIISTALLMLINYKMDLLKSLKKFIIFQMKIMTVYKLIATHISIFQSLKWHQASAKILVVLLMVLLINLNRRTYKELFNQMLIIPIKHNKKVFK